MRLFTISLAALALLGPAKGLAATPQAEVTYSVQRGDTLHGLADRYLWKASDYRQLQALNRVREPRRLTVGARLRVPIKLLRTEPVLARIAAFRGGVTIQGPSGALTPARGLELGRGSAVATAQDGFVTLELPDGSRVSLPSRSRLQIVDLQRVLLTGEIQRRFALTHGRSEAVVRPSPNTRDTFVIETPIAVAAVRGTEFRMKHDEATGRAALEVMEGRVANRQQGADDDVLVPGGFGSFVTTAGVGAPGPLLPAPELKRSDLLQDEPELTFRPVPVAQAASYRVQIATDAGFMDVLTEVESATAPLVAPSVPNGTYFVRLTATDSQGLEGMRTTYAFARRLNGLALSAAEALEGGLGQFRFRWASQGEGEATYRFVITQGSAEGPAVLDIPGLKGDEVVVRDLPAGRYFWRVLVTRMDETGPDLKWSPVQSFETVL